jgi:hypothetical protein
MNKIEVCNTIRAYELEIYARRKIQALIVATSLMLLLALSILELRGISWALIGALVLLLLTVEFWFQYTRKHKVICNSCSADLVLGLRTNYELLENKCSSCEGEIYET